MTKIPMTADGYARLEEELKHLKEDVEDPELIERIDKDIDRLQYARDY